MIHVINLLVPGTKKWNELIKSIMHSNPIVHSAVYIVVGVLFPLDRFYYIGKAGFELVFLLPHPPDIMTMSGS